MDLCIILPNSIPAARGPTYGKPSVAPGPLSVALDQKRSAPAKSLCVSLLGDALAPHGGAIWLGDLIELLAPLGINERLLRTSVFRLVAQNWLQSERHGRRSLYLISELGQRHAAHASQRIYEGAPQDWNGEWTLVALPRIGNGLAERAELRRELIWEGFGMIAPGLFAHPHTQASAAHDILEKLGIPDRALVLSARDLADAGGLPIASLASQCWNLDDVAEQYRAFSKNFGPLENCWTRRPRPPRPSSSASCCCTIGAGSSCTIPTCQARCCPTTGQDARRANCAGVSTGACSTPPRRTWTRWPPATTNATRRSRRTWRRASAAGPPDSTKSDWIQGRMRRPMLRHPGATDRRIACAP